MQQQVSLKTGKSFSLTTFQPVQSDVSVGETVREEVGIWAKSLLKALDELRTIAKQVKMELSLTPFQRSRVYGKTRDQYSLFCTALFRLTTITLAGGLVSHSIQRKR